MIRSTLAALALFTGGAAAQDCGPPDAPCQIEGGFYHASLPEQPAIGTVVFLHGYGGRAAATIANVGLMNAFNSEGYAVIAVQGRPRFEGDRGGSWNSMARPAPRRDDVAFIAAAADDAATRFGLPRDAMLLSGFSGGGMMTWRVACDAPDAFSAYAPIAGTFWRPVPTDCAAPVNLFHTHGKSDTVVPLEGRTVGSGITQGDVFTVFENQRQLSDCASANEEFTSGRYTIGVWQNCTDQIDLRIALHDGGHAIPSGWVDMTLEWYTSVR